MCFSWGVFSLEVVVELGFCVEPVEEGCYVLPAKHHGQMTLKEEALFVVVDKVRLLRLSALKARCLFVEMTRPHHLEK